MLLWGVESFKDWIDSVTDYFKEHGSLHTLYDSVIIGTDPANLPIGWQQEHSAPILFTLWYLRDLIVAILISPVLYGAIRLFNGYFILFLGIAYIFNLWHDSVIFGGDKYQCQTFQEKWNVFRILREKILLFDQTKIEEKIKEAFSYYDIDWFEPVRRQSMTWEQVKEISLHPLCTIGGHTVSHLALNKLSDQEFREEIADGVNKLQSATGKPIQHFAYPYGSPNEIGEREYKLISEFNFKTVFTAYGGCITENNKHQITHLPRVYLHE